MVSAAERGDLLAYVNADLRFHVELLGLAGNAHLVEIARDLRYRARLYGLKTMSERGTLADSAREHVAILRRPEVRGESDAARTIMEHHIQHIRGIWADDRPE
ncbi:FCD domain-containing protein [Sphaerisporangium sp. NBC_01403]|uniref:FCD domain-containing protein n=1 Tax=Sphaerisporangium sp. NBC_01403 TaxID=2903599 RepID=UPI003253439A